MSSEFKRYDELLLERLKNPEEAQAYLEVALDVFIEDHDRAVFLQALRAVAMAQGGLGKLSKKLNLNRPNLSEKGNPKLYTIGALIKGLGFKMSLKMTDLPGEKHY